MANYSYYVSNDGFVAYKFVGIAGNNPSLTFNRGDIVTFYITSPGHPFWIKTDPGVGTGNTYNKGVINNGTSNGTIVFEVPGDAPSSLYYQCQIHGLMVGVINIQGDFITTTTTTTSTTDTPPEQTTTTTTTTTTTQAPLISTTPVPAVGDQITTTTTPDPTFVVITHSELAGFYSRYYYSYNTAKNINALSARISWSAIGSELFGFQDHDLPIGVDNQFFDISISSLSIPNNEFEIYVTLFLSDGTTRTSNALIFETPTTTTTTTTTTTDSPEPILVEKSGLQECPCGRVIFPQGSLKNKNDGLKVLLKTNSGDYSVDLLHGRDILLFKEQKFVTITNIVQQDELVNSIAIYIDSDSYGRLEIENTLSITVRDFNSRSILAHKIIGIQDAKIRIKNTNSIDKPSIDFNIPTPINLKDNAIIFEIQSACRYDDSPCCDSLPTSIQLFGDNIICLPLEEYYDPDDLESTTTTPHPDAISFIENLSAVIEDGKIKLTAIIDTYYHSDFEYYVELLGESCTSRLSLPLTGSSNKQIVFYDDTIGNNTYRIFVSSPTEAYSNTVFIQNTTTSTTEPPDPELTTTYTTAPPPPPPLINSVFYDEGGEIFSFSWELNSPLSSLSEIVLSYSTSSGSQSFTFTPNSNEWENLTSGYDLNLTSDGCLVYSFVLKVKTSKYSQSPPIEIITSDVPSVPLSLSVNQYESPSSTILDVSWDAPLDDGGCGTLTYRIEYRKSGTQDWILHDDEISSTSETITDLELSSDYFVRIAAVNLNGAGPYASNDPNSELLLHLDYAYDDPDSDAILTPDSSSYGRAVQCHVGYINEPAIPEEYFGGDNVKFGDGSFSPDLDTCPVDSDIYDNIAFDYNYKHMRFLSSRVADSVEQPWFSNNSTIEAYDGSNNKMTIEFWIKIPNISQFTSTNKPVIFDTYGTDVNAIDQHVLRMSLDFVSSSSVNVLLSLDQNADTFNPYRNYYVNSNYSINNENVLSISDNDWHHIALVMDGSLNNSNDQKYISIYLDGTLSYNTDVQFDESATLITDYHSVPFTIDDIGFAVGSYTFNFQSDVVSSCFHLDEFRLSTNTMYCGNFIPPSTTFDLVDQSPCVQGELKIENYSIDDPPCALDLRIVNGDIPNTVVSMKIDVQGTDSNGTLISYSRTSPVYSDDTNSALQTNGLSVYHYYYGSTHNPPRLQLRLFDETAWSNITVTMTTLDASNNQVSQGSITSLSTDDCSD